MEWKDLLSFRCTLCGNCCREPIVLITDEDIRRIMHRTNQEVGEIAAFYKPSEIEWSKSQPGWIKFESGKKIMGLRRTENGCQYLGEDDRCTIYEGRPVTCRRYPFDVEMDENEDIELLSISDSVECPYELDGYNALGEIRALCVWEEEEENPYFKKIESWNKKKGKGSKEDFFGHIGL